MLEQFSQNLSISHSKYLSFSCLIYSWTIFKLLLCQLPPLVQINLFLPELPLCNALRASSHIPSQSLISWGKQTWLTSPPLLYPSLVLSSTCSNTAQRCIRHLYLPPEQSKLHLPLIDHKIRVLWVGGTLKLTLFHPLHGQGHFQYPRVLQALSNLEHCQGCEIPH